MKFSLFSRFFSDIDGSIPCNFFHDGDGFSVGVVVSGSDGTGGEIKQGFPKGQSPTQCLAVCNRYSLFPFTFGERLFTAAGSVKLCLLPISIEKHLCTDSFGDQKVLSIQDLFSYRFIFL